MFGDQEYSSPENSKTREENMRAHAGSEHQSEHHPGSCQSGRPLDKKKKRKRRREERADCRNANGGRGKTVLRRFWQGKRRNASRRRGSGKLRDDIGRRPREKRRRHRRRRREGASSRWTARVNSARKHYSTTRIGYVGPHWLI